MESFAATLIRLRNQRGYSQSELSRLSGVSQPLISMYESSDPTARRPTIDNLIALAKALRVTPNALLGWPEGQPLPDFAKQAGDKLASLPPDHPTRKAIETLLGLEPGEPKKTEGDKKD
jgi:transcriptional regulator with XRE-family HTH domain